MLCILTCESLGMLLALLKNENIGLKRREKILSTWPLSVPVVLSLPNTGTLTQLFLCYFVTVILLLL